MILGGWKYNLENISVKLHCFFLDFFQFFDFATTFLKKTKLYKNVLLAAYSPFILVSKMC